MDIPKEILVVPLKEKIPLIKDKKKALKIVGSLVSLAAFLIYLYYYPAPKEFSFQNALPIGIMLALIFITTVLTSYIFLPFRKAILIGAIALATVITNKSRIITIITYAIAFPLLFINLQNRQNHPTPLPKKPQ